VVAYDPLALNVQIDGPNGKDFSNVWVIKKQDRVKRAGQDDQVTALAFYYIVGDAIYQAPSVAKIMTNRMVNSPFHPLYQKLTSSSSPPPHL
jgi:mediator of RNA polymerase II transcription subunit 6